MTNDHRHLEFAYDIVVIGTSSAGLFAGHQLSNRGKSVAVFDRATEIARERRTLIVTPEIEKTSNGIRNTKLHSTSRMAVQSNGSKLSVRLSEPDPIIDRAEFARALAEKASKVGTKIVFGWTFKSFFNSNVGLRLNFETPLGTKTVIAKEAVIGADGIFSRVAVAAGIQRPPVVSILQAEIPLPTSWDPDVTQVWFDTNETRFFYWLIPESAKRCVVGLVGDPGQKIGQLLKIFLARHDWKTEAYQAAQVALHHPKLRPWGRIGRVPIYLVGDAAGHVKVTTVGGTVPGLLGAQAAVRAILNGTHYGRELRALKRELDLHWLIRKLLDRLDNRGYDRLIESLSDRTRDFLGRHNRDSMAPVFWQLPLVEPRLLKVLASCLFGQRSRR